MPPKKRKRHLTALANAKRVVNLKAHARACAVLAFVNCCVPPVVALDRPELSGGPADVLLDALTEMHEQFDAELGDVWGAGELVPLEETIDLTPSAEEDAVPLLTELDALFAALPVDPQTVFIAEEGVRGEVNVGLVPTLAGNVQAPGRHLHIIGPQHRNTLWKKAKANELAARNTPSIAHSFGASKLGEKHDLARRSWAAVCDDALATLSTFEDKDSEVFVLKRVVGLRSFFALTHPTAKQRMLKKDAFDHLALTLKKGLAKR
jgi:hypothetical protein